MVVLLYVPARFDGARSAPAGVVAEATFENAEAYAPLTARILYS